MCELLIKLATFWLAATRSLLDAFSQPTSQPEASQPSPKQACSIHARPLWPSLGLFGPRLISCSFVVVTHSLIISYSFAFHQLFTSS